MPLAQEQTAFVKARRRRVRAWPWVGGLLLATWFGLYLWIYRVSPALVSPWAVWAGLEQGTLPRDVEVLLIAVAPVLGLVVFVLVAAFVLIGFGMARIERRLLHIIAALAESTH